KGLKRQKEAKTIKNRQETGKRQRVKSKTENPAGSARHSQTQSKMETKKSKSQKSSQGTIIVKSPKIQGLALKFKDQGPKLPKSGSVFIKKEKKKRRHKGRICNFRNFFYTTKGGTQPQGPKATTLQSF
ncbi:hypothetical protein Tco_0102486, partial [Tanacetum coccineum]